MQKNAQLRQGESKIETYHLNAVDVKMVDKEKGGKMHKDFIDFSLWWTIRRINILKYGCGR